jgi:hypothetical protein
VSDEPYEWRAARDRDSDTLAVIACAALGDYQAEQRGRIGKRLARRAAGRPTGRGLGRLLR